MDEIGTAAWLAVDKCGRQRQKREADVNRPAGTGDFHIIFVSEGSCRAWYDGREYILAEKDFAVYLPHEPQRYILGGSTTLWVHFTGDGAREILSRCGLAGGIFRGGSGEVRTLFNQMIRTSRINSPLRDIRAAGLLCQLLCELSQSVVGTGQTNEAVAALVEHIHEQYASPLDVNVFAEKAHLSRSHFEHLFRCQVGEAPHRYLLTVRLREASWLLRYTDLSVAQVGEAVGFDDPFYFSRLYKKRYGYSPKEARRGR